jgi:hypothetical protein
VSTMWEVVKGGRLIHPINLSVGGIYAMKKKKKKKLIIQRHHLSYDPEITVTIRRNEHWLITLLQRFSSLSSGAKKAIRYELKRKKTFRMPRKGG